MDPAKLLAFDGQHFFRGGDGFSQFPFATQFPAFTMEEVTLLDPLLMLGRMLLRWGGEHRWLVVRQDEGRLDGGKAGYRDPNRPVKWYSKKRCALHNIRHSGGTWVCGQLNGYRFEALVFPKHATNPEWELGDSRISKLWLQRLVDTHMVYNWDRGMDVHAADDEVAAVVDFLAAGLTDFALHK